ncbi:MAG: hypothetical protein BWY89_00197 [Bacteroidetes bacterium ADurb.BinA012]|nr:MAG: hypothetical protein BWY89_00197 [Bacteroidetes bacterium ADurb.BinA012]
METSSGLITPTREADAKFRVTAVPPLYCLLLATTPVMDSPFAVISAERPVGWVRE